MARARPKFDFGEARGAAAGAPGCWCGGGRKPHPQDWAAAGGEPERAIASHAHALGEHACGLGSETAALRSGQLRGTGARRQCTDHCCSGRGRLAGRYRGACRRRRRSR
jgi:hypothetical protein